MLQDHIRGDLLREPDKFYRFAQTGQRVRFWQADGVLLVDYDEKPQAASARKCAEMLGGMAPDMRRKLSLTGVPGRVGLNACP